MNEPPHLPPLLLDALAKSRQLADSYDKWRVRNRHQFEKVASSVAAYREKTKGWLERHGPQIAAVIGELLVFDQEAKAVEREWREAGLGYLVTPLGMAEKLVISLHANPGDEKELLDFLEACLADPEFVEGASELLLEAEVLTEVPRLHLLHGLGHLRDRQLLEAWPPLIIGLEGAFADVAIDEGIAVRDENHVYLADQDGNRLDKKLPSVEGVAKLLGHPVETDFGEFLTRRVYGGEGNPFRHGTAREGVRERSICLAIAVIGWLDAFVFEDSNELLREAIVKELARRDEASRWESAA
jgi:hypothetical protein